MIATLPDLLAPLGEAEFRAILGARQLLHQRGESPDRFNSLIDWEIFRGVLEKGEFARSKLQITRQGTGVLPAIYMSKGKVDPTSLAKVIASGASALMYSVDVHVPALGILCADIRSRIAERISATAIVTTGSGGALKRHFDDVDVVVLQVEGTKRWKIFAPSVVLVVKGTLAQQPPESDSIFDEVLQPGDLLFVPAGYWHQCENGPERSLHVSILFTPPVGLYAVQALVRRLREEDIFRTPLSRLDGEASQAAQFAAIKARLSEEIERLSPADFLAVYGAGHADIDPYEV